MNAHDQQTAQQFGVLDKLLHLEEDLSRIDRVVDVQFDLLSFLNRGPVWHVIFLLKYDVPLGLPDDQYWGAMRKIRQDAIDISRKHDLLNSGDPIQDMGQHLYFARTCGDSWKPALERAWKQRSGERRDKA